MKKILMFLMAIVIMMSGFSPAKAQNNSELKWTQKAEAPWGWFNDITYGNGTYVAVGYQGLIAFSGDGKEWRKVDVGSRRRVEKVVWNGKLFVAVGEKGLLVTSPDGQKWTKRKDITSDDLVAITWNGSYFLAVSFFTYKSVDGINWTSPKMDQKSFNLLPSYSHALLWDGKQFLLFGNSMSDSIVLSSKDGGKWELKNGKLPGPVYDAAWNGKSYVAAGKGMVMHSSDGAKWTAAKLENMKLSKWEDMRGNSNELSCVRWTGIKFIAVGNSSNWGRLDAAIILESKDGKSWKEVPRDVEKDVNAVYGDSRGNVYVSESAGILWQNTDGIWGEEQNQPPQYNGIAFDGKKYVAVADGGKLLTSGDGIQWKQINPSGEGLENLGYYDLYDITWNGNCFLAVGKQGVTLISSDGENWEIHLVQGSYPSLQRVIWDGSSFIAVSGEFSNRQWFSASEYTAGAIYTSSDGRGWNKAEEVSGAGLYSVAASSDIRVAVGGKGVIFTSEDGEKWTKRTSPTTSNLLSVTYDGKGFIAAGEGVVLHSADGKVWEDQTTRVDGQVEKILWNGSKFVALAINGNKTTGILLSDTGTEWKVNSLPATIEGISDMVWDGKKYIALCHKGARFFIATSTDGLKWTERKDVKNDYLVDLLWTGKNFVAVGYSGIIYTSPDGITWTKRKSGTDTDLYSVAWNGSRYVAAGARYDQQITLISKDGITWSKGRTTKELYGMPKQILWNGKQFLMLRELGNADVSADGVKWKTTEAGKYALNRVLWNGNSYVAVAGNLSYGSHILTSSDGVKWTVRMPSNNGEIFERALQDVAWNGKLYVAVGGSRIYISKDGQQWEEKLLNMSTANFAGIVSNGETYAAVGFQEDHGLLCLSRDGIAWSTMPMTGKEPVRSVFWDGKNYIAVGGNGQVFTAEAK